MNALEFYKSHESAPLPNVGDLVSLTVEELCELMEQYYQSKVNNGVLDDVSSGYCSKENLEGKRCKDICDKPQCGW